MDPYNSAEQQAGAKPPAVNPYAAPEARIAEAVATGELVKSGRGVRLGAVLLDSVPVMVAAVVMAIALPATATADEGMSPLGVSVLVAFGVGMLAYVAYQLILLHRYGQTWGKKLLGIKIVRQDGSRAGLGRIFWLRYFVPGIIGNIPIAGLLFALADPLFIFGEPKRCIHDYIADTIVVNA